MSNLTTHLSKHLRDVHFGGNWTTVNLKDTLADVSREQATTKVPSFNTIAVLVYHINYYISAVTKVLQGSPLSASDKLSFDHPPILSEQDWQDMLNKMWVDAETFAGLIEQLPEEQMWENFTDEKYGNYYRNI
ncbi:MAG: hypothetical protein JWQ38_643, partial [Flavipsychrobacter sp.]|nr:hypothetical protein [Flavipsychrobacter sp.]